MKLAFLCGFMLFFNTVIEGNDVQSALDLNMILKDKKIQIVKNQLIKGWSMRANGSSFYIERNNDIFLPQTALKSIDSRASIVTKTIGKKKVLMMKTKAFFMMTVEKKLPADKVAILRNSAKGVYQTDFYTIILWQEHGFTYSKHTIPHNLIDEFQAIETLMGTNWQ
ncbi:hypothetical protein [Arcicella rosea]|uniref:Isocitrate dehydrogenase kinase/phosphatase n=1 Tax=Arcicella rosea TaxID=502909 RepID=A0A841EHJ2_9BACT|nr:hypothetical protein [Arcicella rosea]MBB6002456.1 isocitrate dehydrogenase kinase/phosphatase [Arcicella rosea]